MIIGGESKLYGMRPPGAPFSFLYDLSSSLAYWKQKRRAKFKSHKELQIPADAQATQYMIYTALSSK